MHIDVQYCKASCLNYNFGRYCDTATAIWYIVYMLHGHGCSTGRVQVEEVTGYMKTNSAQSSLNYQILTKSCKSLN